MSQTPNQTETETELPPDLAQNQDEASDLHLVFGALSGLRSTDTNEAIEKSNRRYDERNHRWHESRLAEKFGVPKEEEVKDNEKGEGDDVGHQVWVRSPVHHHHYQEGSKPAVAEKQSSGLGSALAVAALAGGLTGLTGVAGYMINDYLSNKTQPAVVQPDTDTDSTYKIEKWTPGQ